jgi:hypothetical protein
VQRARKFSACAGGKVGIWRKKRRKKGKEETHGLGDHIGEELESDTTGVVAVDGNVEEDTGVGHGGRTERGERWGAVEW